MSTNRSIVEIVALVALGSGIAGCAAAPPVSVPVALREAPQLLCGVDETQMCERLSAFSFGQCECVRLSSR